MEEIVVIGGVAAGMSAASRARRLSPGARITVLERGPAASYGACGLPAFLAGEVASLDMLVAHSPDFFREQRNIEVLTGHEALEIEPGRRRVRVRGPAGELWLGYDKLILSTGARAAWQPSGAVLRHVYCPLAWTGAAALDAALRGPEGLRRVVVVGGGYIGLEMAEALSRRGLQVTLIEARAALLAGFDADLAGELPPRMETEGIDCRIATRVIGLEGPVGGRVLGVTTAQGVIEADAVINCAGLLPETALAQTAGCIVGPTGAIAVDERQQTSVAGIFAAGDCAEARHRVSGAPTWIPLGAVANQQGRVAGENAAGGRARYPGILGTLAVPLFGLEWGRTGLTLEQARTSGFAAAATTVTSGSQAAYMQPRSMTMKLVFDTSNQRLLGCHMVGEPGTVTGRLDTAAAALAARMTLTDVETLDLAYAPGLAPLYEPLQIAAHQARGRR